MAAGGGQSTQPNMVIRTQHCPTFCNGLSQSQGDAGRAIYGHWAAAVPAPAPVCSILGTVVSDARPGHNIVMMSWENTDSCRCQHMHTLAHSHPDTQRHRHRHTVTQNSLKVPFVYAIAAQCSENHKETKGLKNPASLFYYVRVYISKYWFVLVNCREI